MDRQIKKILIKCIILLEKGYSIKYCLSKYSKHKNMLEGYLQDLEDLNKIIPIELEEDYLKSNLNKIHERLDDEIRELKPETPYRKPVILRPAIVFLSIFIVLIFSFSGLIYASQSSIPGGDLYLVKRTFEDVKLKTYPELMMGPLHYQLLKSRIYESAFLLNNSDNNDLIIGDLIEEIDLEFLQCKKYAYFGNKTEGEVLKVIQLIKHKYKERLGEIEEDLETDPEQIFEEKEEIDLESSTEADSLFKEQDEELPQDTTDQEIEEPDKEESDSETNIEKEDIEPDDEDDGYIDDGSDGGYIDDEDDGYIDDEDDGSEVDEEDDEPEEDDEQEED